MTIAAPPTPWASLETNYPADPTKAWGSQPCKVAPAGDLFTPNSKIPAEVLNYILNARDAELAAANDRACAQALSNFSPTVAASAVSGAASFSDVTWDSRRQRWVANTKTSGFAGVPVSDDGGKTWVNWGSAIAAAGDGAAVINPNNGDVALLHDSAVAGSGFAFYPGATGAGVSVTAPASGADWGSKPVGAYFAGSPTTPWHFFSYNGGAPNITNFWWITGTSAATPVLASNTAAVPTSWKTSGSPGNLIVSQTTTPASSFLLVAICGVIGTGTPRLGYTTDGTTLTDVTSALPGGTITGLHYSSVDGVFGLMTYDGTNSHLYVSPPFTIAFGASWTLVHTFSGYICKGLHTIGRTWTTMIQDTALVFPVRLIGSSNLAALGLSATWSAFNCTIPAGTLFERSIKSSGQQSLIFTSANVSPGFQAASNPAITIY